MIELVEDDWGKADVRLVRLVRTGEWHEVYDQEVSTQLRGDTEDAYWLGSNAKILSTDAQRNAVYAMAGEQPPDVPEAFALRLARWFLESQDTVERAEVTIRQRQWRRVGLPDGPAPHSFQGGDGDLRVARVAVSGDVCEITAGVTGLELLNATGSEFLGFPHDRFTTGRGVADRILATRLDAEWRYASEAPDFNALHASVREQLVRTFATTYSTSIQLTMRTMAEAVLEGQPEITSLKLELPNLHHTVVDLEPFGVENERTVFVTAPGPHSVIRATFAR